MLSQLGTRRLSVLSEHLQNLHTLKSFKSNADDVNNVASCARTWIAAVHSTRLPVLPEWKKKGWEQKERGGKEDPSSGLSNDKLAIYDTVEARWAGKNYKRVGFARWNLGANRRGHFHYGGGDDDYANGN